MYPKAKAWITTTTFLLIVFGFTFSFFICPDAGLSVSERRKLKQLPEINKESLTNGKFFDEFEEYMQDQFPARESLRTFKASAELFLFMKADNNDIYLYKGHVCKQEYPLDGEAVGQAADKINEIYRKLFDGKKAFYSIIPDKNYFLALPSGHLAYDYTSLFEIMDSRIAEDIHLIDVSRELSIKRYYKTDLHWKQEAIIPIADIILSAMEESIPRRQYTEHKLEPFYGSYFGQAALPISADQLIYLTNEILDDCTVYDPLQGEYSQLYEVAEFGGIDPYNIYLSGAKPILIITNPSNDTRKELYIIRDSFSSSLAPLLVDNYSKVVLIDPRYIDPAVASKYISPAEQSTILFIFSTTILNKGYLFR